MCVKFDSTIYYCKGTDEEVIFLKNWRHSCPYLINNNINIYSSVTYQALHCESPQKYLKARLEKHITLFRLQFIRHKEDPGHTCIDKGNTRDLNNIYLFRNNVNIRLRCSDEMRQENPPFLFDHKQYQSHSKRWGERQTQRSPHLYIQWYPILLYSNWVCFSAFKDEKKSQSVCGRPLFGLEFRVCHFILPKRMNSKTSSLVLWGFYWFLVHTIQNLL